MSKLNLEEKYFWVDVLRGYAILLIMLIHSSHYCYSSFGVKKIADAGYMGVQLFFIVSSFTLFNSFSKRENKGLNNLNRDFFIRRYFRIAPFYYMAGIIYVIYRVFIKDESVVVKYLLANLTFTNGIYLPAINNIPPGGWSIGIEMLFYLFVPLLFRYIKSLKSALILFILSVLISFFVNKLFSEEIVGFIRLNWDNVKSDAFYFWLPYQMPFFVLGIILYFVNKKKHIPLKIGHVLFYGSIFLFILFQFYDYNPQLFLYGVLSKEYICGIIFVCFAIGTYTLNSRNFINNIISKLGVLSFSLYLNHFLILYFLGYLYGGFMKFINLYFGIPDYVFKNDFVFFMFYFLLISIATFLSGYTHKYVELEGVKFGNKIISRLT